MKAGVTMPAAPIHSRRSLLIVDDCRDWTDSLAILGRVWGYDVEVANSGPEAIHLAARRPPDATVLDLGMPGMDGYEVARRLRRLPGLEGALFIAVSGYSGKEYRHRSREAGCDFHLTKPVDLVHLRQILSVPRREEGMSREQLNHWMVSLDQAADVVEAIESPELQRLRGWDLSGWRYELVPFGVQFTRADRDTAPLRITVGMYDDHQQQCRTRAEERCRELVEQFIR